MTKIIIRKIRRTLMVLTLLTWIALCVYSFLFVLFETNVQLADKTTIIRLVAGVLFGLLSTGTLYMIEEEFFE